MDGVPFKTRAIAFALGSGALVFILALLAAGTVTDDAEGIAVALVLAIVCAVMSWASAERALAGTAQAIDAMAKRLAEAAEGDLVGPTPSEVTEQLPGLAIAMEGLFGRVRENIATSSALALSDPVTQLPNRIHFRREVERMLAEAPIGAEAALLFIDLDRFKTVNDSLGHVRGDQLLLMVAKRLSKVVAEVRAIDADRHAMVARLAGDEFTLFLPDIRAAEDATRIAERVLTALDEPFAIAGRQIELGASVGVSLYPRHGRDLTTVMRAADVAMFHAKTMGRGRFQLFDTVLATRIEDRLQLDGELRRAIEAGEFELAFQPQIALPQGHVVAAEALIRWRHPLHGLRMPASFIDMAEESGLIVEIGNWVIEAVSDTLARWAHAGMPQRLSFNVSPRQIERPDFFDHLMETFHFAGAPPQRLELEITETLAMRCSPGVLEGIAMLRAHGMVIAIDDFGTGYSNLARLKDLPLDRVKLDRSLTVEVARSAEAREIANAVVSLVHGLGCEVVAEGVEDAMQAEVLRVIGCDLLQGFHIARPMTEAAFRAFAGESSAELMRM